jgi:hypothetical protein
MNYQSGTRATFGLVALLCLSSLAVPSSAIAQSSSGTPAQSSSGSSSDSTQSGTEPAGSQTEASIDETFHYDNLWEISGGLAYMNPKNGQAIVQRADIGGGRVAATQWIYPRLGATADVRFYEGLGDALPNAYSVNSPLMTESFVTAGPEWRWIRSQAIGISFHGLVGGAYGTFNGHVPSGVSSTILGLYPNSTTLAIIGGANVDFIRSPGFAIRITPDLVATRFGGQFQENFSVTAGFVWHFGKF